MPAESDLAESRVRQATRLSVVDYATGSEIEKLIRTDGDGNARLSQDVEGGLGDEARTEHEHPEKRQ